MNENDLSKKSMWRTSQAAFFYFYLLPKEKANIRNILNHVITPPCIITQRHTHLT